MLNKDDRRHIVDVLNEYGIIENKRYTIKHLTDMVVESFVNAISQDEVDLFRLPHIN